MKRQHGHTYSRLDSPGSVSVFGFVALLRDPKDDLVLEAAVAANADYLVTYNISDFDGASSLGIRVITPPQLLALIPSALP